MMTCSKPKQARRSLRSGKVRRGEFWEVGHLVEESRSALGHLQAALLREVRAPEVHPAAVRRVRQASWRAVNSPAVNSPAGELTASKRGRIDRGRVDR